MRKNIKPEIIQKAKKLFNERGYNEVSTQDIANAMGISKGNLNYHFKRKEDIMEAVVEEMHSHYVKPEPPSTLEELNKLFYAPGKLPGRMRFISGITHNWPRHQKKSRTYRARLSKIVMFCFQKHSNV